MTNFMLVLEETGVHSPLSPHAVHPPHSLTAEYKSEFENLWQHLNVFQKNIVLISSKHCGWVLIIESTTYASRLHSMYWENKTQVLPSMKGTLMSDVLGISIQLHIEICKLILDLLKL